MKGEFELANILKMTSHAKGGEKYCLELLFKGNTGNIVNIAFDDEAAREEVRDVFTSAYSRHSSFAQSQTFRPSELI